MPCGGGLWVLGCVKHMAIQVAIQLQFKAIRSHFEQFVANEGCESVGVVAIRAPDSVPL